MTAEEIVLAIGDALERAGIHYMTVGGLAGIYYGINRTTDDADFVIQVDELNPSHCGVSASTFTGRAPLPNFT